MSDDRDQLEKYIKESLVSGYKINEIRRALLDTGRSEAQVREILSKIKMPAIRSADVANSSIVHNRQLVRSRKIRSVLNILSVSMIAILGVSVFYLQQDRLDLADKKSRETRDFYTRLAASQVAFTNAGEMIFPDEQKFIDKKREYIIAKIDFIEADLRTMKIVLYENGAILKEMNILTKGKEGSWWETPTGDYRIIGKEINHFSSIGNVWMPYSMQFYGNYFIHGWPYYDDGTPVAKNYSGGCIRLSTEDAQTVFDFAKKGTPVLVLEDESTAGFGSLKPKIASAAPPIIAAKAFLIADIASGETILEKQADKGLPIASLTKLMTGIVAHEMIYLGRIIKVDSKMLANALGIFNVEVGESYSGFDLLYPLLMQSSNDSAKTIAAFLGEENFIDNMNNKAVSLKMTDTRFADTSGISAQNISTANDLEKLLQYIYYKRRFLFDITKGKVFENVGTVRIGDTLVIGELKNFNEFAAEPDLIGMKNGETTAAKQTMASVWNIHAPSGDVPVAIIVLGSDDRARDTAKLLKWLKDSFEILE